MKTQFLPRTIIQDTRWYREWTGYSSFVVAAPLALLIRRRLLYPLVDGYVVPTITRDFGLSLGVHVSHFAALVLIYLFMWGTIFSALDWFVKKHDDKVWSTAFTKKELEEMEFADQVYHDVGTSKETQREIDAWQDRLMAQKKITPRRGSS